MAQHVTAQHLTRLACLYVRQSTLQQVLENTESTSRQYALRERARALGWADERIVVIDQDLGHSGASTVDRLGFQRLVAEVGLGQVGLVLGLEVSRLARNSRDWHHLLEICALTHTLILDEEGLYDPSTFNDRLLLGLMDYATPRTKSLFLIQICWCKRAFVRSFAAFSIPVLHSRPFAIFTRNSCSFLGGFVTDRIQGLIICGKCGERMTVRYHQRGGKRIIPDYLCQHKSIEQGGSPCPPCQRVPGADLDRMIGTLLVERVTPETLALTLAAQEEIIQRAAEAQRLRHLQVERAQYEADLAQRRYLKVDPDNRLVACVLEAEWNAKLRELEAARAIEEQDNQNDQHQVSAEERVEIDAVSARFRQFWNDPKTTVRQRKHAVRLLMEDVTVHKADQIVAHIRFKGGATQTITVALPPPFAQSRLTAPSTLEAIDRLLDEYTDAQVAEQLNLQGYRTFDGLLFESMHVCQLRRHHGLPDRYARLRAQGMLTADELAHHHGVTAQTIWRWYRQGRIVGICYNDRRSSLFPLQEVDQQRPAELS